MNCIVIDDEPLAREGLCSYVKEIDFLKLKGCKENPLEALSVMEQETIDLIFLDIQMPKINGLDFLKSLSDPPLVIITTAFPSFALEGFQLDVLDYLVKPITFQRLFKAANKAKHRLDLIKGKAESNKDTHFFIKCDNKFEKIKISEILYVEAMQNYINLYTERGKFTTLLSLKNILAELPQNQFLQIHKSYVVALDKIESVEGNLVKIRHFQIPVSRSNREVLMEKVVKGRLLKK